MKRKVIGLLCIALFAIGCATTNPCAPLIDTPVTYENTVINTVMYYVKVHDTDGDGVGDTLAVYVQHRESGDFVEYLHRPLNDKEKAYLEKQAQEKAASETPATN